MKRGSNEQELRERIAYIHGRIERELEAFASSLAIPAVELTQRMGALLLGVGERDENHLPDVRLAAREGSVLVAKVESPVKPHGGGSRPRKELGDGSSSNKAAQSEVKPLSAIKQYWAKMSPEERKKIMKARQKKWSVEAKAKWGKGPKQKSVPAQETKE